MSTKNEKCWFCGTREADGRVEHHFTKANEHVVVPVPRCTPCAKTQRTAIILFFVLFGVITIGGFAMLFIDLMSSGEEIGSGSRAGRLLGMLSAVPGLIFGMLAYKMTLKAGGTRGHRYALEHPAVREKRAQGYAPGTPRT